MDGASTIASHTDNTYFIAVSPVHWSDSNFMLRFASCAFRNKSVHCDKFCIIQPCVITNHSLFLIFIMMELDKRLTHLFLFPQFLLFVQLFRISVHVTGILKM